MTHAGRFLLALAFTSLSACGGGVNPFIEAEEPHVTFADATSSAAEGSTVSVTLRLDSADPLTEPVSFTVRDTGGGTGTPGDDYVAFAQQTILFPIGTSGGTTETIELTLHDDQAVEGSSETVGLLIENISGAREGTLGHSLSILDDDVAELSFDPGLPTDLVEGGASVDVRVELGLDAGETLEADLTFVLEVTGGSATAGDDYSFTPTTLTVPAGSVDGASVGTPLALLDNTDIESIETLVIGMSSLSDGASTNQATHQFEIMDDDVGSGSDLLVRVSEGGGPATDASSGASFDFGGVGARSVSSAIRLEIQNGSATDLDLDGLRLTGSALDFSFLTVPDGGAPPPAPSPRRFPFAAGAQDAREGVELVLDPVACAELCTLQRVRLAGVPLGTFGAGESVELDLQRVPLPWAADGLVYVDGNPYAPEELLGDLSLWRGTIVGEPDSDVYLGLSPRGSNGWVRRGAERFELVGGRRAERGSARLISARAMGELASEAPRVCADPVAVPGDDAPPGPGYTTEDVSVGFGAAPCRVSIETDYQYYQLFNDAGDTTAYVTQLLGAISMIYERDVQATFEVAYLGIHTNSDDGWTTQETTSNTADMLDEFRSAWDFGDAPVAADLYHLFSGADLGGGRGYLGVLCNQAFGFSVSGNMHGLIDWATFDHQPGGLTWDLVVAAHEWGHNFDSPHTHEFCPAVDTCGDATCSDPQSCAQAGSGTIMSYCHTCAGGMANIQLEFSPRAAATMRSHIAASCLGARSLASGATVRFDVRFAPLDTGLKQGTLTFEHAAGNQPTPFTLGFDGTGQ